MDSIVDQHFEGVLSDVGRRLRGARDWHYSLQEVVELDTQIETHCEALLSQTTSSQLNELYTANTDPAAAFFQVLVTTLSTSVADTTSFLHQISRDPEKLYYAQAALAWSQKSLLPQLSGLLTGQRERDLVPLVLAVCVQRCDRQNVNLAALLRVDNVRIQLMSIELLRITAAQDVSNLFGCILRIDVDNADKGKQYAVPKDNPFVDLENARPEIWAYGLRNPWKSL